MTTHGSNTTWPGAFSSIKFGFQAIKKNSQFAIIYIALNSIGGFLSFQNPKSPIGALLSLATSLILMVAFTKYGLATARPETTSIGEFLSTSVTEYFRVFGALVVFVGLVIVSAIGLFIPLIWFVPWTTFILFAVVDRHVGVFKSFWISKQLGQHHKGKVWGITGVSFLLAVAVDLIGMVPVIGWIIGAVAIGAISLSTCTAAARLYYFAEEHSR